MQAEVFFVIIFINKTSTIDIVTSTIDIVTSTIDIVTSCCFAFYLGKYYANMQGFRGLLIAGSVCLQVSWIMLLWA